MARKKADDQPAQSNTGIDDVAECFLEIKELNSAIARLNQKKGATFSRFANMGVDVDAVKACIKLEREDDAPEWIKRVAQTAAILRIVPSETQADGQATFAPAFTVTPVTAPMADRLAIHRAFWAGHDAGMAGGAEDENSFEPGTELFVNWVKGFKDGWEDRLIKKPGSDKVTQADTAVRPRGRPRKDRAADKEPETALERDEAAYREPAAIH